MEPSGGKCVVCGNGPTVKSHLLPAALMHDQRRDAKELIGIQAGARHHVGLQSGHWDRILCRTHEEATAKADRHAVAFHREFRDRAALIANGLAWEVTDVDRELLAIFAYGCIWRTVIAGGAVASLGPYRDHLAAILFKGATERFPILLQRVNHIGADGRETSISILPHRMRMGQASTWSFSVAGIRWHVKMDQREWPDPLPEVAGADNLLVLNRDPMFIGTDPDLRQLRRPRGPRRARLW